MELNKACWIGGSARSGKSSIASHFAASNNIRLYHADEYIGDVITKKFIAAKEKYPHLWILQNESHNIIRKPLEEYLNILMGIHKETFEFLKNDIINLTTSDIIIVEGMSLLPDLLYNCGITNACFLVSTQEFFEEKAEFHADLQTQNDSKKLNDNINAMMKAMRTYIEQNAKKFEFKLIPVDREHTLDVNTRLVAEYFSLPMP